MELGINLATRCYFDSRRLNAALGTAVAVLLIIAFFNVKGIATAVGHEKMMREELAKLQSRFDTSAKGVSEGDYQKLMKEISAANAILEKRGVNWLLLLDRLEVVVPDGVAISSIEPKVKDGTLTISGSAREFRYLRILVENLEADPAFSEVFLQNQNEIKQGENQRGIGFTVSCRVEFS